MCFYATGHNRHNRVLIMQTCYYIYLIHLIRLNNVQFETMIFGNTKGGNCEPYRLETGVISEW